MKKSLLPLIFILAACEYNDSRVLSTDLRVSVFAAPNGASEAVALQFFTEAIMSAVYPIIYENTRTSSGFVVEFKGIMIDERALQKPGPASCHVDLGDLRPGTYNIEIRNGANVNTGYLNVTAFGATLSIPRPIGIKVVAGYRL